MKGSRKLRRATASKSKHTVSMKGSRKLVLPDVTAVKTIVKSSMDKRLQTYIFQPNISSYTIPVIGAGGAPNQGFNLFGKTGLNSVMINWEDAGYIDLVSNGLVQQPLLGNKIKVKKIVVDGFLFQNTPVSSVQLGTTQNGTGGIVNALVRGFLYLDKQPQFGITGAYPIYDFLNNTALAQGQNLLQSMTITSPLSLHNQMKSERWTMCRDKIIHFNGLTGNYKRFKLTYKKPFVTEFAPSSAVQSLNDASPIKNVPYLNFCISTDTTTNPVDVAYVATIYFEQMI